MSKSGTTMNAGAATAPGREHERLNAFVGSWTMAGQAYDSPFGPRAEVSALQTYSWLTGGRFLIHRLEGRLGDDEMACIEVTGYDVAGGGYTVHSFYSNGTRNEWQLDEDENTWTLTGEWAAQSRTLKVRCTSRFDDTRNTVTCKWEYSSDGARWQTFWDTRMTRA